jgi:hypothetical protein
MCMRAAKLDWRALDLFGGDLCGQVFVIRQIRRRRLLTAALLSS